jgi:hypothetical protein
MTDQRCLTSAIARQSALTVNRAPNTEYTRGEVVELLGQGI